MRRQERPEQVRTREGAGWDQDGRS